MAAWSERRGYTLCLSQHAVEQPLGRYVRLALVRRTGMLPLFNVAESRAERGEGEAIPRQVGDARLSSWRWLTQIEAEGALAHRLTTLERLGYEVSSMSESSGGEWDWLRELVRHQLDGVRQASAASREGTRDEAPSEVEANGVGDTSETSDGTHTSDDADTTDRATSPTKAPRTMSDALGRLGVDPKELVERVTKIVEQRLEGDGVDTRVLSFDDVDAIAASLPDLLVHEDPTVRHVAMRWLDRPTAPFELDRDRLVEVLCSEHPLTHLMAGHVRAQGLALLGVEGVHRVADEAVVEAMRDAAASWKARLP